MSALKVERISESMISEPRPIFSSRNFSEGPVGEGRKRIPQRLAGNPHEARKWLTKFKDRKMAADAESPKMHKATTVVALLSAKRLKLANRMASQKISTTRNGIGIAAPRPRRTGVSASFPSSRGCLSPWLEGSGLSFAATVSKISSCNVKAVALTSSGSTLPGVGTVLTPDPIGHRGDRAT